MKRSIGIDINTESIKIVSLKRGNNSYGLDAFGIFSYRGDVERLKNFIKESGFSMSDVRVNIESPTIKIRRLDLPPMPNDELSEAVKWGFKDVVKEDVDSYLFKYTKISAEDIQVENKIPLVVYAIKKESVESRLKFLSDAGIGKPKVLEPSASALGLIYGYSKTGKVDDCGVLIDIGENVSNFVVMGHGGLLFSRLLSGCADENLIDQIARDLGVGIKDAEETKRKFLNENKKTGLDNNAVTILGSTFSHFFSKLAIEIQRSLDGFSLLFGKRKIENVNICGVGSYYGGVKDYLSTTLGCEVSIFDPFGRMNLSEFMPSQLDGRKSLFAVACGLAVD